MNMTEPFAESMDRAWTGVFRVAGVTTFVITFFFLFDVVCWIALGPSPTTAEGWFTLLREKRSVAILLLSFPTLFGAALYCLTFLGLYRVLRDVNRGWASLASLFAFIGLAIPLAANTGYTLVNLGARYAAATTEAQRIMLSTAGEGEMAAGAAGLNMGGFLLEGAALIFSLLMLRSKVFGAVTAWLGIVGHGLDFIRTAMNLSFLPEWMGAPLLMIGGLPQLIWLVLVGRTLFRLGSAKGSNAPQVA
jgi:hypothetical protein